MMRRCVVRTRAGGLGVFAYASNVKTVLTPATGVDSLKTALSRLNGGVYGVLRGAARRAGRIGRRRWEMSWGPADVKCDEVVRLRLGLADCATKYVGVSALALRYRPGAFRRSGWVAVCSVGRAGGGVCSLARVLTEAAR